MTCCELVKLVKGARSTTTTNVMMMSNASSRMNDRSGLLKKDTRQKHVARRFDSVGKNDLRSSVNFECVLESYFRRDRPYLAAESAGIIRAAS